MPHGDFEKLTPLMIEALWQRLGTGMAAKPAARALGLGMSTVRSYLIRCGGIRPAPRARGAGKLSLAEREEISRGLAAGDSLRAIARRLGRAPSTISREVAANGGRRRYRALRADERAWAKASRPKRCKLAVSERLAHLVAAKLLKRWSPQQIAGWLKTAFPDDEGMQVSHESIYRTLFVQTRGALRKELTQYLRTGRVLRRPKGARLPDGRGARPGTVHTPNAPPRQRTVPFPGTGKVIWSSARA